MRRTNKNKDSVPVNSLQADDTEIEALESDDPDFQQGQI